MFAIYDVDLFKYGNTVSGRFSGYLLGVLQVRISQRQIRDLKGVRDELKMRMQRGPAARLEFIIKDIENAVSVGAEDGGKAETTD